MCSAARWEVNFKNRILRVPNTNERYCPRMTYIYVTSEVFNTWTREVYRAVPRREESRSKQYHHPGSHISRHSTTHLTTVQPDTVSNSTDSLSACTTIPLSAILSTPCPANSRSRICTADQAQFFGIAVVDGEAHVEMGAWCIPLYTCSDIVRLRCHVLSPRRNPTLRNSK